MAGLFPQGADRAAHRATYLANIKLAAEKLARHGLVLVLEPINTRDMPGYFINYQAEGHAVCAEIGAPNLKADGLLP